MLPGVVEPVRTVRDGQQIAEDIGYPVIIKAASGGGGRGMSVVHSAADLANGIAHCSAAIRSSSRRLRPPT
jgi:acetyl-CoA carboxylase biotin carboxylase subunit